LVLSLFFPSSRSYAFQPISSLGTHRTALNRRHLSVTGTPILMQKERCIEVEQKFSTEHLDAVHKRLGDIGFIPGKESKFMDWYFDNTDFTLCTQDCWLRFRHPSDSPDKGSWQLKKGRRISNYVSMGCSSTIYEEMEGSDAIDIVETLLEAGSAKTKDMSIDDDDAGNATMDGYAIPKIPRLSGYAMKPFARIETIRSSWKAIATDTESIDQIYDCITVDIDGTDYGYTVGEVETVVTTDEEVNDAKEKVQRVIEEITGEEPSGPSPAIGKLETYLIKNRPDVYEACIKSGSMKSH